MALQIYGTNCITLLQFDPCECLPVVQRETRHINCHGGGLIRTTPRAVHNLSSLFVISNRNPNPVNLTITLCLQCQVSNPNPKSVPCKEFRRFGAAPVKK